MPDFEEYTIEDLQRLLTENINATAQEQLELDLAKKELELIEEQLRAVARRKSELVNKLSVNRVEKNKLEKQLEAKTKLQEVEEEQKRLLKEFEEKTAKLDALTASAYWREFAFSYQIEGAKKLAVAQRGILGDKRGLGKTLTAIITCDMSEAKRVLVIAPNNIVKQFASEIRHWAPTRSIYALNGMNPVQREAVYPILKMIPEFVILLNYEAWRRDKTIVDNLIELGLDMVILDEAHYIKSSTKLTARGVFQVVYTPNKCESCGEISNSWGPWEKVKEARYANSNETIQKVVRDDIELQATGVCLKCEGITRPSVTNVLAMTGTPLLNKPVELFSLLHLVNRERWRKENDFLNMYTYPIGAGKYAFNGRGLKRLTDSMSEFFLARKREDTGIDVPPPSITVHTIEKDKVKYAKQYKAELDLLNYSTMLLADGTRKDVFFILELILRQRQMMTWPAGIELRDPDTKQVVCKFDVEQSQKLDEVTELLLDLHEEGERTVVFSQFKAPLEELYKRLNSVGVHVTMATGDSGKWHIEQVINDFDLKTAKTGEVGHPDGPRWEIVLATYQTFNEGANLNAARHMILLDEAWNPGKEDQAIGRIDRINSTDQANVHIFRVENSVDDFMAELIEEKRKMIEGFEGQMESSFTDSLKKFFGDF